MTGMRWTVLAVACWGLLAMGSAQTATLVGRVLDASGTALPGASVLPVGFNRLARTSDADGRFALELPAGHRLECRFSFVGYESETRTFDFASGDTVRIEVRLRAGVALGTSEVVADGERANPVRRIDPRVAVRIPSPRGSIEDLLLQAPVNFTSELSSGYNVRGGSFDENLVYVNDIEVYRPFLVRAGQQEEIGRASCRERV